MQAPGSESEEQCDDDIVNSRSQKMFLGTVGENTVD